MAATCTSISSHVPPVCASWTFVSYGFNGCCPKEYEDVGLEIVRKCKCLPLAIVVIGGLLYRKSAPEWKQFSQNLKLRNGGEEFRVKYCSKIFKSK